MRTASIIFLVTILSSAGVSAQDIKDYRSPDGAYSARITNYKKSTTSTNESIIEILKDGKTIVSESYESEDAEHGFGVQRHAWTHDSLFFVYSVLSSGGHQAWHSPTYFIYVKDSSIRKLDSYSGLVTSPEFTVKAPDLVEVMATDLEKERLVTISLSKAIENEHK